MSLILVSFHCCKILCDLTVNPFFLNKSGTYIHLKAYNEREQVGKISYSMCT